MDQTNTDSVIVNESRNWRKLISFFLVIILTCLIVAFIWFSDSKQKDSRFQTETISANGLVYLTLLPLSGEQAGRADVHFFDIEDRNLIRFADSDNTSMTATARRAGRHDLIFSTIRRTSEDKGPETFITKFDPLFGTVTYYEKSTFGDHNKQLPSWSETRQGALYNSPATPEYINAEDSNVYFVDALDTKFLTPGSYPQFLPDGEHFIVLKNDGLYLMKLDNDLSVKILNSFDDSSFANQFFDINLDGTKLVWSQPQSNMFYIINISNLLSDTTSAVVETKVKSWGTWPTFSPDGQQFATIQSQTNNDKTTLQLVIFDIAGKSKGNVLDLSSYNKDRIIISDWVTKI